jgi:hypothetical protein
MLQHSLPTMDITPLRDVCFADTGIRMPENFVDVVKELAPTGSWEYSLFSRREYGNETNEFNDDPSNIKQLFDRNKLDPRLITRQKRSAIKQAVHLGNLGTVNEPTNKVGEMLYDILGDNRKHFGVIGLVKMDSDSGLIPHKDGSGTCRTYIPIYPFGEDYSRLEIYYENQIYYIYNYESPPPMYIFSSRCIHAAFNQGYPERMNMQIECLLPYNEMVALFDESSG